MSQGQTVLDLDLKLINAKSVDFEKPKLFFKNIGKYVATSAHIHIRIPFNITQILHTKTTIEENYVKLLNIH